MELMNHNQITQKPAPTLWTLGDYTMEEVYHHVREHLLLQGCKSMCEDGEDCQYRGENDTACAVGFLIPDEKYDPSLEGDMVENVIVNYNIEQVSDQMLLLLSTLQTIHDGYPADYWQDKLPENFEKFAKDNGIEMDDIDPNE